MSGSNQPNHEQDKSGKRKQRVELPEPHQHTFALDEVDILSSGSGAFSSAASSDIIRPGTSSLMRRGTSAILQRRPYAYAPPTRENPSQPVNSHLSFYRRNFADIPVRAPNRSRVQPRIMVGLVGGTKAPGAEGVADPVMRNPAQPVGAEMEKDRPHAARPTDLPRPGRAPQPMPGARIQRAIEKGRLNVIGENHDESDPRRELEQAYLAEHTGSDGYWTELELRVGVQSDDSDLFDRRERGDPVLLHVGYRVRNVQERLAHLGLTGSGNMPSIPTPEFFMGDLTSTWRSVKAFYWDVGKYDFTQTDYHELNDAEKTIIRASRDTLDEGDTHYERIKAYYDNERPAAAFVEVDPEARAKVVAELQAFAKVLGILGDTIAGSNASAADLNTGREDAMHRAAKSMATTRKGAWKIGEDHIAPLEARQRQDQSTYPITHKDEFNQKLKAWKPEPSVLDEIFGHLGHLVSSSEAKGK